MSNATIILPGNSTPLERALEDVAGELLAIPVEFHKLWNPDECPATHLHILALIYSVDVWNADWPEATKRAVIRAAPAVHRLKGTRAALTTAINALGMGASIEEWFEHGGDAYTFRLLLSLGTAEPWRLADALTLYRVAIGAKNARSDLSSIVVRRPTSPAPAVVGAAIRIRARISNRPEPLTSLQPQRSNIHAGFVVRTRTRLRIGV